MNRSARATRSLTVVAGISVAAILLLSCAAGIDARSGAHALGKQPIELGLVKWQRDFEKGVAAAKKSGKPMLVLFQEVPG